MNTLDILAFEDPILLSAPLARGASATLCLHEDGHGQGCGWYHGVLPYMRFLETTADPRSHAPFFLRNFGALAKNGGFEHVLVSGAADYCMTAQVIHGYREAGVEANITVVDRCETPLMLNSWYADRVSADVRTVASPIMDYRPDAPFDVICTHCFLGYFDPQTRPRVVERWNDWLRPGGKVVTVNGIRRGFTGDMIRFSPEHAEAYVNEVVRRARARRDRLDIDPATLEAWAKAYTANFWNYPTCSEDEMSGFFEAAGFTVDYIHTGLVESQTEKGLQGPSVLGAVEYTSIVATR
jgi:SAM-dependent methyltransferase